MALKTLVITPAGEEKIWDRDRNLDLTSQVKAEYAFTGRFAERCREYSKKFYPDDRVILSPRYGFVLPHEEIKNYAGDTFAGSGIEYDTIEINAESDGLLNYERVIFLGSNKLHSEYVNVISKVFADKWVEYPLSDSENIEEMLGRLTDAITRDMPLRFNRIKPLEIEIFGLFGKFDYRIPLENPGNISIITAPNGYGKTTILRLLRAVFVGNLGEIRDIPFKALKILFGITGTVSEPEKMTTLKIEKCLGELQGKKLPVGDLWSLNFRLEKSGNRVLEYTVNPDNFDEAETSWELSRIIPPVPVKLISAQRLWQNAESDILREGDLLASHAGGIRRSYELTVLNYSDDIRMRIQAMLNDYAASAQELDSTYPERFMDLCQELDNGILPEAQQIIEKLSKIRLEQKKLREVGFLSYEPGEWQDNFITGEDIEGNTGILAALQLYVEDIEKKCLIFGDLERKIDLLIMIINSLFLNLSFEIRADKGFNFMVADNEPVAPEKLSSGEQNQLVMYYDLIFLTDPGTLVLVDEPEISLHIVWQRLYLEFIRKITSITGSGFLIATHSPQLIHTNWDCTVDLSGERVDE